MGLTFETTRRVEFCEVDYAGFVHFIHYLRFMEEAEYAFLRSLGLDVVMRDERGLYGFPRMAASCKYRLPARYNDQLRVRVEVLANDGKSLSYAFSILRDDQLLATGELQAACVRFPLEGSPFAIPLPDTILEKIPLQTRSANP